jgi:hypothetical protein
MALPFNVALGALAAVVVWTITGLALTRRLFPERPLALSAAPALGWAACNAAALPVFLLSGFTSATVAVFAAVAVTGSLASLWRGAVRPRVPLEDALVPAFAIIAAALLALAPAVAILPKAGEHGVLLASPIFDHSKIAVIDAMSRLGLPVINPFFGEVGQPAPFAYYYLWHFSAATIALLTGVSGWEADAALTWFTAFASLTLMMGLAVRLGGRPSAAFWVLPLAAAGSLRPVLESLLGSERLELLIRPGTGFAGWLFQATWSPQHLASASCLLLTVLLLERLAERAGVRIGAVLVLAASFESSIWVGGFTTALAAPVAALVLLRQLEPGRRWRFMIATAACALLAVVLATPLLLDQLRFAALRGLGSPLELSPYPVLGTLFPEPMRRLLDLPAYWLVLLVVQFPAIYLAGTAMLAAFLVSPDPHPARRRLPALLAALTATSLVVGWLLVSTVGDNNDLGWRAVLPGLMVLICLAAVGLSRWLARPAPFIAATALALTALGLPDSAGVVHGSVTGNRSAVSGEEFAGTPALWEAVRRHAGPTDRIANNPLFLRDMTPWPVNISWALLADRPSCYAGEELALAFTPLSPTRREAIERQFTRIFAGDASSADLDELTSRYDCRVAVVTAQDGAWDSDPFASHPRWKLAEMAAGRWRIYKGPKD